MAGMSNWNKNTKCPSHTEGSSTMQKDDLQNKQFTRNKAKRKRER